MAIISVTYSPPAGIAAVIGDQLDGAASTIDILIYRFTETTLAAKMANAVARGVTCRAILDFKSAYQTDSMAWQLSRTGVLVWTDAAHSQMHQKSAIIDASKIITGSANWSQNADGFSAEDLLIITFDPPLVTLYQQNWQKHREHSVPLPR